MMTRILPRDEWYRLTDTDILTILPFIDPQRMKVIVVEEGDRIVGAWAVLTMQHLEGVWIDPQYRKNPRVASRLLTMTLDVAAQESAWAMTASLDAPTTRLLTKHLGAVSVPGEMFIVPTRKDAH